MVAPSPVSLARSGSILSSTDCAAVELINAESHSDIVLICEHAGNAVPHQLQQLGLTPAQLRLHIALDIGAAELARRMAGRLQCPLVLQPYSRLVIDCNRPVVAEDSCTAVSDGVAIPGNQTIPAAQRRLRINSIFEPFHNAVAALLDAKPRRAIFAIHSFTPSLQGVERPWELGFLFRHDATTSKHLAAHIARARPDLTIGMNQPYTVDDASDWFVPVHGEQRGLQHSLIEVRNNELQHDWQQAEYAALLSDAIESCPPPVNP